MNSIPSKSNTPDAEQMRLAFEAFMLQGKGAATSTAAGGDASTTTSTTTSTNSKKKKKKKRPSTGTSPQKQTTTPPKTEPISSPSPSTLNQSTKKRYYQLLRSFSNKIQQSWFEVDDQMLAVLENIVSIRGRLPLEWKMLNLYDNTRPCYKGQGMGGQNWKHAGCRGTHEMKHPLHLHRADVQLALENDLDQHEKMISALRSLISELSETHDSLGRLVDTIWMFHLDSQEVILEVEDENKEQDEMDSLVQNTNVMFQVLSTELYQKQSLIPAVIRSINDEMLFASSDPVSTESTPLEVARSCHKDWRRQIDGELLAWLSKLSSH